MAANSDEVIAFVPLPTGSRLNNVWLDVSVLGGTQGVVGASMYGIGGYVVDVDDPDTAQGYDLIWDKVIQKDSNLQHQAVGSGVGTGPFDTSGVLDWPEVEVGEFDLEAIFGSELLGNMEIFRRRELITFPKRPIGFHTSADLTALWYTPVDAFKTHIRGGPTVEEPSVAMFGFSAPAMDRTKGTISSTPSEIEWIMTQYAEVFLYDMWKFLMGLSAASGEYPDSTASDWFAELLEDFMIEDADYIQANSYVVTTKVTWDITVPGKPGTMVLTSE